MAIVEQEHVENWFDLTLKLDDYFTHYPDYIFRGQADANWKLEPTLTRAIRDIYPEASDNKSLSKSILNTFKKNIRGRCSIDFDSAKDDEIWALGQHYGLYTPLLDWTRSPYAAVYFSLIGESKSGVRSIYGLLEQDVDDLYAVQQSIADEDKIRVVEPLTHANSRLVSQRGLFLYVPPTESVEARVDQLKVQSHTTLYKFTFPDSIKNDALAALNLRNINSASLFPDINGSAMQTNYEFAAEKHFAKMRESGWPEA